MAPGPLTVYSLPTLQPSIQDPNVPLARVPFLAFQLSRINDILHLSLERGDYHRARRAWSILSRCGMFDWRAMWKLGLATLGNVHQMNSKSKESKERIEYLRVCLLRGYKTDKEEMLSELVLTLIKFSRYEEAYKELEFHLLSMPFGDNVALNTYAGMLALQLALSSPSNEDPSVALESAKLYESKNYFEHVKRLKPDDSNAQTFLSVGVLTPFSTVKNLLGQEDSEDGDEEDGNDQAESSDDGEDELLEQLRSLYRPVAVLDRRWFKFSKPFSAPLGSLNL
ncbi:uncharacterized protein EI90DRAFT_3017943 [Cantharellus anzutake]|uniref:uncharacterized protein n=1 Tax=Cantharellus anzutake TaxID=1750568 RepID=UPI0019064133|nr:uncharacterized protein EI90DRAFT_3017943 [Cantharellus anzutake]KAF8327948.1 hypothetical protein EI90DRAFT_3017943 [Cantharellus anzutake]